MDKPQAKSKVYDLVFSGAQPTGHLTIGNYLGAIRSWVKMQELYPCLFCIVDFHAITIPQNPKILSSNIATNLAIYLACGISPEKSIIFQQSAVSEHTELSWILSCITSMGWLNRMTQFKDKAKNKEDMASLGLYAYPVLMAADILLYRATHVPVGADQKQHLELTRDIAGAFNRQFDIEYFRLPEPIIEARVQRIMSLKDGYKKMSKSDLLDSSRINISDKAEVINDKIRKAKTDAITGIWYDTKERPEISNLLTIYAAMMDISVEEAQKEVGDMQTGSFKTLLADVIIDEIVPMYNKAEEIVKDKVYINQVMKIGAEKARVIAARTIKEVKEICGFITKT